MILRIRSRDGLERVTVADPAAATVATLRSLIDVHLGVPAASQTLSLDPNILLPSSSASASAAPLPASTRLSSLPLSHGSLVYLSYHPSLRRRRSALPPPPSVHRKPMTVADLLSRQICVARQEAPHCAASSFDQDAAHAFQIFATDALAFSVKRAGFLYGRIHPTNRAVTVDFIYEPPQQGSEDSASLFRDADEEALVEAIAAGLDTRRVGFIFTQAVGRKAGTGRYTMSGREVLQAAEMQSEGRIREWVTAVVKLEGGDGRAAAVHLEAFQMSDTCVRLFKEGWFAPPQLGKEGDPGVSRMKNDVLVVGRKETREVDNDLFLVPVKISDHQGLLSSKFPIENRIKATTLKDLKSHLDRTKSLPFIKRISDFHLLLFLARYLDANVDVPVLTECIKKQASVPEGYQLLIEYLATAAS